MEDLRIKTNVYVLLVSKGIIVIMVKKKTIDKLKLYNINLNNTNIQHVDRILLAPIAPECVQCIKHAVKKWCFVQIVSDALARQDIMETIVKQVN